MFLYKLDLRTTLACAGVKSTILPAAFQSDPRYCPRPRNIKRSLERRDFIKAYAKKLRAERAAVTDDGAVAVSAASVASAATRLLHAERSGDDDDGAVTASAVSATSAASAATAAMFVLRA